MDLRMPRTQRLFRYGVMIHETVVDCVTAIVRTTNNNRTQWHAQSESEELEEEVARELFPSVSGTYYVSVFSLKPADRLPSED